MSIVVTEKKKLRDDAEKNTVFASAGSICESIVKMYAESRSLYASVKLLAVARKTPVDALQNEDRIIVSEPVDRGFI